jgi:YHS domain-containing protein
LANDPVCGMNVDEKKAVGSSSYADKTYYFCSSSCKNEFDKNPRKYAR